MPRLPDTMKPQAAPGTWESVFCLLPEKGHVLNVGAGRGGISWLLREAGYEVTSVDLHPEHFMVDNLECRFADLNHPLPFADGTFNIVLAVEVIEHLENPWQFIREAIRVLRDDGVFLVTTPNVSNLMSRLTYLLEGVFPYFRDDSFSLIYHVTPIFPWTIERCCRTTSAKVEEVGYSRVDWPRKTDVPRHDSGRGLRRVLKQLRRVILNRLPLNRFTGEIACYKIRRIATPPLVTIGIHDR